MQSKTIKNWATDDRPREKMLQKGIASLSNSELLAIIINNGTAQKTAVDLAKELLLANTNSLQALGKLNVQQITALKIKGLGVAKAIAIVAALELGSRRHAETFKKEKVLNSADIAQYLQTILQHKNHEVFVVVMLNNANIIIHHEVISVGGITGTIADPRLIFKRALEFEATQIVLCHNHPSGHLKPSKTDELLTQKLKAAGSLLDIRVTDHIIVSTEGYFSFADEGIL
jgi:DNA repair protein RadC